MLNPKDGIYELISKRYDLIPGECVFIDDTEKNIIAAREFGMNGIVFKTYEQVEDELQALGVR